MVAGSFIMWKEGGTIGIKTRLLSDRWRTGRGVPHGGIPDLKLVYPILVFRGDDPQGYARLDGHCDSIHGRPCDCGSCALGLVALKPIAAQLCDYGGCYYLVSISD